MFKNVQIRTFHNILDHKIGNSQKMSYLVSVWIGVDCYTEDTRWSTRHLRSQLSIGGPVVYITFIASRYDLRYVSIKNKDLSFCQDFV